LDKQASGSIQLITRLDPKITVGNPTTSEQLTDLHMTNLGTSRSANNVEASTREEEDHTGVLAAVGRPLHHG
jgi:hypothetical protein